MSRFVNAIVVGVVALVVLSGAIFYFIQSSDSAGANDDRDDGNTPSETTGDSPSPTDTTEPSPTNTTDPSPTTTSGNGNSTGNNTTSLSPASGANETGNQSGNGTSLSPWLVPPWRATPFFSIGSAVLWAAVAEPPRAGGPHR